MDVRKKTSENVNQRLPSKNDISEILCIVKMACLEHQKIPTSSGDYLEKAMIRNKYLKKMILFCLEKNIYDTLAYLYYEWFSKDQFFLWARSSNETFVCRYRTSMFAESHFR